MADARRAAVEGRLRIHRAFPSRYLSTRRDLIVYVPPGYDDSDRRFPVLYLHDGQNLFDPATAFGGRDWGADIAADTLICRGEIQPLLIVGIYNTGRHRISEYTPTRDRRMRKGGKAGRYAQSLAREVKPFIDRQYRTLRDCASTAVGGSSLGALASLAIALDYPKVFGAAALLSPSAWWDGRSVLNLVAEYKGTMPRIWLDTGTCEGNSPQNVVEDARLLRDALLQKNWRGPSQFAYHEFEGATHSEDAWAARFPSVLQFLFPVNRPERGIE